MIDQNTARSIWLFREQNGVGGLPGQQGLSSLPACKQFVNDVKTNNFSDEI
jgi:hypothetical protein